MTSFLRIVFAPRVLHGAWPPVTGKEDHKLALLSRFFSPFDPETVAHPHANSTTAAATIMPFIGFFIF